MKLKIAVTLLMAGLLMVACGTGEQGKDISTSGALTASHEEAQKWAQVTLEQMTLEEKAAQMMFEVLNASYMAEDDPKFQYFVRLVRDFGLGGFVLSGGSPQETARLLNRFQAEAEIPVFVSNAFESGPGQMIRGASEFPANMAFAAIRDEKLTKRAGEIGAKEGRAMGVHITWSPTVDIQTRPENPVQSTRSFGGDLDLLAQQASAYIQGYQENAMFAAAKHFPGRGDVDLIPGSEFTINNKSAEQVINEDFFAFKKAIEAGVTFIMSDHIAVPSVTEGSELPGSVEARLATYWLREKLGFEGVLISDDMWYEKVINRFGKVESCIMAIKAGHDAILKPGDAEATIAALSAAVRAGKISEEQIDRSVSKLLYYKARLNLHQNRFVDESKVANSVAIQAHTAFVNEVADRSLTLLINKDFFPVGANGIGNVMHLSIQGLDVDTGPGIAAEKLGAAFDITHNIVLRPDTSDEVYQTALQTASSADTVIISLFNPRARYIDNGPLQAKDLNLINKIVRLKPHATVVMSYGNPYPAANLKNVTAFLVGYGEGGFYGNKTVYMDSFIKLLQGKMGLQGKLPVKVSDDFPIGSGIVLQ